MILGRSSTSPYNIQHRYLRWKKMAACYVLPISLSPHLLLLERIPGLFFFSFFCGGFSVPGFPPQRDLFFDYVCGFPPLLCVLVIIGRFCLARAMIRRWWRCQLCPLFVFKHSQNFVFWFRCFENSFIQTICALTRHIFESYTFGCVVSSRGCSNNLNCDLTINYGCET